MLNDDDSTHTTHKKRKKNRDKVLGRVQALAGLHVRIEVLTLGALVAPFDTTPFWDAALAEAVAGGLGNDGSGLLLGSGTDVQVCVVCGVSRPGFFFLLAVRRSA